MSPWRIGLVPIVSFLTAAITMPWLGHRLLRARIIDAPEGSLAHSPGKPRGGGLGILAGILAGLFAGGWVDISTPRLGFLAAVLVLGTMGWLDDRGVRLPVPLRLGTQTAAGLFVVWLQGGIDTWPLPAGFAGSTSGLGPLIAVIWIVAVTNFYNFMDGIDGLAGVQALTAGLVLSAVAPAETVLEPGLALSGACAGFLLHNWHPARIVMGDVGSQAIGFFIACLPFLTPVARRSEAILIVAIALAFCLTDCTFTLLRRLARGERIWEGHREHLYQRLIRTGLRHDQVAGWIAIAGLPASALGVAGFRLGRPSLEWAALGVALAMFGAHLARTLKRERG